MKASAEQALVNAEMEVRRAVFLMNAAHNQDFPEYQDLDCSDSTVRLHIKEAILLLRKANKS